MQIEAGDQGWDWEPEPETGADKYKCATYLADGFILDNAKIFRSHV